ncbi:hypothetical protein LTR70_005365 [Exophiala xenobiotica]|uniref:Uncharacterized protein n=1 Tax=Lithohypha guttulata TaxID=1690604 RepID=A0ABR0K2S8_9EURO|nr:hypothetical protein LTR24_007495 [Lithohypha guttulata]KAK5318451.1 hypothetical protein LTR70_005365 [Exophiala xenobiotica]
MRGRYEVEDLLKLRASPLVARPTSLPPKEEWMGPADPRPRTATTKSRGDDAFNQVEGFQKRPSLLDAGRRSTTDPERIHLGPPRNSFASSNAARTRNGTHERTTTNEDVDRKLTDRRSGAFEGFNGKFGARTNDEHSGTDRLRRRNDDSDLDARPRRDPDRPRWSNRDDERIDESGQRNGREGYSRAKFDQPWSRGNKMVEVEGDSPAWRRGQRDREFDRNDAEPEWVDSVDSAEPAKAHTHEDFREWMEMMKNKTTGDDKSAQIDPTQKEVAIFESAKPPPRVVSDSSASVDKFFARFEKDKSAEGTAVSTKPTKSRFASIFGSKDEPKQDAATPLSSLALPPAPPPPAELEQTAPAADTTTKNAQEAAFAKLLDMLKTNQSASPAPSQLQSTRSPANIAELASTKSPDLRAAPSTHEQSTRTPVSSHTPNISLDRLLESRSPAHHTQNEQPSQPKAGPQDLLDLLRRSDLHERHPLQQQPGPTSQQIHRMPQPPPGLSSLHPHDTERQNPQLINTRRDNPRSIFDDPAFSGYRNEPEFQHRNPQPNDHDGLGGLFAAMNNRNYVSNTQQDPRPTTQALPNPPPGLQRPPGLDQGSRPLPGWPSSNQQQQQQQRPQPQHVAHAGPQQPLYGQGAYPHQQQAPRQMPQRKPTGEMPLPPGFAGMPPGFGPSPTYASPTSPDSAMQFAMRGGYGINERERMERERQQNAFAAMYGSSNANRGGNGGVQLPPGFR